MGDFKKNIDRAFESAKDKAEELKGEAKEKARELKVMVEDKARELKDKA
jgi:gas vesicle protein